MADLATPLPGMGPLPGTGRAVWSGLLRPRFVACTALLLILGLTILYPIYLLIFNGFIVELPGGGSRFGLDHWIKAWFTPGLVTSIVNTFDRVIVTEIIAMPLAIVIAWFAARTDIPGVKFITASMWISSSPRCAASA